MEMKKLMVAAILVAGSFCITGCEKKSETEQPKADAAVTAEKAQKQAGDAVQSASKAANDAAKSASKAAGDAVDGLKKASK